MVYPAFDAKEVTGNVLLKNPSLMELWKWAADEGKVQALSVKGKNYAVVKDEDLAEQIGAAGVPIYRYDDETKSLELPVTSISSQSRKKR